MQEVGRGGDDGGATLATDEGMLVDDAVLRHGTYAVRHISNPLIEPLLFVSRAMRRYSPSASST